MSPRLRIRKSEVVRILLAWHARLGEAIPRLADRLEDGPEAFARVWEDFHAATMPEVLAELEAAAEDGPRAA